jgi:transcriptional regulator with XRE-family HTH domain
MNNKEILKRIISIIEDSNLTNSEFAEKIGVPKSTISHLLSERNNPSLDIVSKISSTFNDITSDYLIFGQSQIENSPLQVPSDLFLDKDMDITKESVKESNNKVKSIIIIYENNKFEQIDKL